MTAVLPDVARTSMAGSAWPLDWVGMEEISLPLLICERAGDATTPATADIGVDLPGGPAAVKGIHMSRLYEQLLGLSEQALTPQALTSLMQAAVSSHGDCRSRRAELQLRFPFLLWRPALVSEGRGGWHRYPVTLAVHHDQAGTAMTLSVAVQYSSTCPCSAALSRQRLCEAFDSHFDGRDRLSADEVGQWLTREGSLATPHSQRSTARVQVALSPSASSLGLTALIEAIEDSLQTAVQTLVKRVDEQAFAERNGQNLMYVEDASRRLLDALSTSHDGLSVEVIHHESLHAHNAVARHGPGLSWRAGSCPHE